MDLLMLIYIPESNTLWILQMEKDMWPWKRDSKEDCFLKNVQETVLKNVSRVTKEENSFKS